MCTVMEENRKHYEENRAHLNLGDSEAFALFEAKFPSRGRGSGNVAFGTYTKTRTLEDNPRECLSRDQK
ncbi:hypothetical protein M8J75_009277 [Diaphorina citri]|nr:hypothetical protein M8J75_009277 [Diaphorina citri]